MGDIIPASDKEAKNRDSIRDVKQDDASGNHAIERRITTQIQQSQYRNNEAADEMGSQGDVSTGIDMGEEFGKGKTAVAGERPA